MQYMERVLSRAQLPANCGVAIEYNIPLTSKRVDFIVTGYGPDGAEHANIIELKQWQKVDAVPGMDGIVETYVGGSMRRVTHPSYQAWSYATAIQNFNSGVQEHGIDLHPCAYAHNYDASSPDCALLSDQYEDYLASAPLFGKRQGKNVASLLDEHIAKGDAGRILEIMDNGRIRPSKSLQDSLLSMLDGNPEFTLLDSQKVVYETALAIARKSFTDQRKRVYIVEGGPGTGKSVLAVNLLAQLVGADGQFAQYVSKNSAPREVYKTKLKSGSRKKCEIDLLIKGSGSYIDAEFNSANTIIVDEAHRLNEKSGLYGNQGENQIKELINAAACTVFFIDEHQRVRVDDIGSVAEIEKWAELAEAKVHKGTLDSQFRCNGSDGYLAWVDNALQIRETANVNAAELDFDFEVFDTPAGMQSAIVEKNQEHGRARIVAGYCWDWPKKTRGDSSAHDIKIGSWGISWNLESKEIFALDPGSIHEAGCIHTTQGLEFDYVGVIIGDDLRYEDGHIVTDFHARSKNDRSIKGLKKMEKEDPLKAADIADEIIKNTYRTLMTRGMKGCYVYCTNQGLREHLRGLAQ